MDNGSIKTELIKSYHFIIQFPTLVLTTIINGYMGANLDDGVYCDLYWINVEFNNTQFLIRSNAIKDVSSNHFAPQFVVQNSIGY